MVWKDGQAEIAFKNKNVSQVGQSRKQINPVFSTQQQKVPARFQGCSGFSGRAFSCHQSTATEIPNTFADGTRMDGDAVPDIKAILLFAFICVLRMFRKKVDMINMHAPILATNNGLHDARRHRIQHHNRNNWKAVRGYNN